MKLNPEEAQRQIDEMFAQLPKEIEELQNLIRNSSKRFQTFDIIANISMFNHAQDTEKYADYRPGKDFIAAEILALQCLKSPFVETSEIKIEEFHDKFKELQNNLLKFRSKKEFYIGYNNLKKDGDIIKNLTDALTKENTTVRNPGLPDHHLIISEELFKPLDSQIKQQFGFSIKESVILRKKIPDLINKKIETAQENIKIKTQRWLNLIQKYKKSKIMPSEDIFTIDELNKYSAWPYNNLRKSIQFHLYNQFYFNLSETYSFTSQELADYTKLDIRIVDSFLSQFSCEFPSLMDDDEIYGPVTILHSRPFLHFNSKFLLPSMSLLTWCVDSVIESKLKVLPKLYNKYIDRRHEYLLDKGIECFKNLLPTAEILPKNLYYHFENNRCETDSMIIYDKVLIIIEAKANKLSNKAKEGYELKMKDHLKDIVRDSYAQGIRTLEYITQNSSAVFETDKDQKYFIQKNDFNEVIIVSLTLESLSNVAMNIRATNETGYFSKGNFPWLISVYDLIIIADLLDNPILLIQYIKRRKKFLSYPEFKTHDELDLFAYFLDSGLYVDHHLKEIKARNIDYMTYAPNTDKINDYYMYYFGHKEKATAKPTHYLAKDFNNLLMSIEKNKIPHRVRIGLLLSEFNSRAIDELMEKIRFIKKRFNKDGEVHDCTMGTDSLGKLGVTFMTGTDKDELNFKLSSYCLMKMDQLKANVWIGIGDSCKEIEKYRIDSVFFVVNKNYEID